MSSCWIFTMLLKARNEKINIWRKDECSFLLWSIHEVLHTRSKERREDVHPSLNLGLPEWQLSLPPTSPCHIRILSVIKNKINSWLLKYSQSANFKLSLRHKTLRLKALKHLLTIDHLFLRLASNGKFNGVAHWQTTIIEGWLLLLVVRLVKMNILKLSIMDACSGGLRV